MRDDILEKAVLSVRTEIPDPKKQDAALQRTSEKLAAHDPETTFAASSEPVVLRGCADIQTLIPAFLGGTLSPARALLVGDHCRSCVPCRRVLKAARTGEPEPSSQVATPIPARRPLLFPLAMAATVVLAAALGTFWFLYFGNVSGHVATVEKIDGLLMAPSDGKTFAAGNSIEAGKSIRVGRSGSSILLLADGTRIELASRSEISLAQNRGGITISLTRGRVIVQAAKQRERHLRVKTPDCLVSVKGTVFAVSQGAKGARVSVLEGEVEVDGGRTEKVLHAGDQTQTNRAAAPVALEEDFSWSLNRAAFLELAGEVTRVKRELAATPARGTGRTSTRLLDSMPEGTLVFASLPNISETVASFYEKLAPRLAENPVLASWWGHGPGAPERQEEIKRLLSEIRTWGSYLGDEIVLGVGTSPDGKPGMPLVLTNLVKPGFLEFVQSKTAGGPRVRIVTNLSDVPPGSGETLLVWMRDDLVAAAFDSATLAGLEQALSSPVNGFRNGPFYAQLASAYREGVDVLLGADLESLLQRAVSGAHSEPRAGQMLALSGVLDAESFILRKFSLGEESHSRATLSFRQQRHGLAAWLSAPAPMGSLSFVSSGSAGAIAVVAREPALLVDDIISILSANTPDFPARLASFESENGFEIRKDLAETLGGDVAFAVDGPLLPVPAWKLVIEVYDPARLQSAIERIVSLGAGKARQAGRPEVTLASKSAGGLTIHMLVTASGSIPVQYAFVDGYLVVAPGQALILRAAEVHRTGDTLLTAPKLVALLPKDGPLDFSMLAYQDVGGILGTLAQSVGAAPGSAASDLASSGASLGWAWAGPSSITFGSSGAGISDVLSLAAVSQAVTPPATGGR